jgi:hypothetical protein
MELSYEPLNLSSGGNLRLTDIGARFELSKFVANFLKGFGICVSKIAVEKLPATLA